MKRTAVLCAGFLVWLAGAECVYADDSLQAKINAAVPNETITLPNETYTGNLAITKPLTLKGSGHTVIRGDGTGNVITITAQDVTLENLVIEHGGMSRNSEEEFAAVRVQNSRNNVLRNLKISDAFHGVFLDYANDNTIEQIEVTGQGEMEIGGQGNGINLNHSHGNKLLANVIRGSRDGIYFNYSDNNQTTDNVIQNTRYGLHYMYSNENRFERNKFTRNTGGAAIMVSKHIFLNENEFSFHQGAQAFGILMQESEDVEIKNNKFFQNLRGLYIDNSRDSRITGNSFLHNQLGIELWASASGQIFSENTFFNNTAPVITIGGRGSSNKWSTNQKGNYWGSDLPMLDLDQNGVGDASVTYKSSLYGLVQENELVYLFLKSPAITLYEKMGQLLNRQEVMLEDPYPLLTTRNNGNGTAIWIAALALAGIAAIWYRRRKSA